jgi:hypothetical protein
MASDFTVIQAVRQRFGGGPVSEFPFEQQAPNVGNSKDFRFSCPNVNPSEIGVLQFESLGVTAGRFAQERNILQINGVDIPGAITPGPLQPPSDRTTGERIWKSHLLLVPANVLRDQNVLHIEAISITGPGFNPDHFIIDNVVVFFKTRGTVRDTVGARTRLGSKKSTTTSKKRGTMHAQKKARRR